MPKKWLKKDTEALKKTASDKTVDELAKAHGATPAEVKAKLDQLGLTSAGEGNPYDDPSVGKYEDAVKKLAKGQWAGAAKALEAVVTESPLPEVVDRARQMLFVARQRQGEEGAGTDDPFLEAVVEKNRGNLEAALELCKRGGRQGKDERFALLAASIYALEEKADEAADALEKAIEMNPTNRVHAFHDPDFQLLRDQDEHRHLFGLS